MLYILLLLIFLSSPSISTLLVHPTVASFLPRTFSICAGPVTLSSHPSLHALIPATLDTSDLVAVATVFNEVAGSRLVEDIVDAQILGAFLEDQISITLFRRRSYKRALERGGGSGPAPGSPGKVLVTSQSCTPSSSGTSTFLEGWFAVDLSTFNALLPSEYEFYFERVGLREVVVDHGVWSDWGTEELRTFASNAGEWMVSGGNVVLMGPEDDGVVGEAVLDVKGKETMREMGFQQNNVDTETEIFLGTDHTKNAISFSRRHLNSPSPNVGISSVFVINLDRRPDRWSSMQSSLSQSSITSSPTRIPASDGNTMDLVNTPLLSQLFSLKSWSYGGASGNPYQDHAYRTSVLGCAYSHFRTWERIDVSSRSYEEGRGLSKGEGLVGEQSQMYLVLEDDVEFVGDFWNDERLWPELVERLRNNNQWDVCFLGTLDERDMYGDTTVFKVGGWDVQRMSTEGRAHGAGAFAVLLRPRGARALLDLARSESIKQAVDWFVFDAIKEGKITGYKLMPMVAKSPEGEGRDSDNDQDYKHTRLLMMKGNGGGAVGDNKDMKVDMRVNRPGRCAVDDGGGIEVTLDMEVTEPANVFIERQKSSKLCFSLSLLSGSSVSATFSSSIQKSNNPVTVGGGESKSIGCSSFQESSTKFEGLEVGRYKVRVDMGKLWEGEGGGGGYSAEALFEVRDNCDDYVEDGECRSTEVIIGNNREFIEWCEVEGERRLFQIAAEYCGDKVGLVDCVDQVVERILLG